MEISCICCSTQNSLVEEIFEKRANSRAASNRLSHDNPATVMIVQPTMHRIHPSLSVIRQCPSLHRSSTLYSSLFFVICQLNAIPVFNKNTPTSHDPLSRSHQRYHNTFFMLDNIFLSVTMLSSMLGTHFLFLWTKFYYIAPSLLAISAFMVPFLAPCEILYVCLFHVRNYTKFCPSKNTLHSCMGAKENLRNAPIPERELFYYVRRQNRRKRKNKIGENFKMHTVHYRAVIMDCREDFPFFRNT